MSGTLVVTTLKDGASATNNLTFDTNGNATVGGTLSMASSFMRNRLINGTMAIDQRNAGASQTITAGANIAYTIDRWFAYCTGANITGQRVSGTAPSQYAYKFTGASSNSGVGFAQRIEQLNCYDLASGAVTISTTMTSSAPLTVTWYLYCPSSTADTWSAVPGTTGTQIATGTFSVTTTRTAFSATISSTSMAAQANANLGLELRFVVSALGNGATWTIENTQLESGTQATAFERRQYGSELMLAQRYCETGTARLRCFTNSAALSAIGSYISFSVTKRSAPTTTLSNISYNNSSNATAASYTNGFLFYCDTPGSNPILDTIATYLSTAEL